MSNGGVCRTAPATPGLLKKKKTNYLKFPDLFGGNVVIWPE